MIVNSRIQGVNNEIDFIGNARTRAYLNKVREAGRLAHAYLFVGTEQVGKTTAAAQLAANLLNTKKLEQHPDFVLVERGRDAKTGKLHGSIVIEQIRLLCGRLAMSAFMGGWKVCIIDGAHFLKTESANALLKNLEEPHPRTLFILTAPSADRVMPTIRSRCQSIFFSRVPAKEIADALAALGLPPERAMLFARLADGRPGRAIAYARNPEAFGKMSALRDALLGLPELPVADRFAAIDKFLPAKLPFQESSERARDALDLAAELFRDALLMAYGREAPIHGDARDRLSVWLRLLGAERIAAALENIAAAKKMLAENVGPRAVLDNFAASF